MENKRNDLSSDSCTIDEFGIREINCMLKPFSKKDIETAFEKIDEFKNLLTRLPAPEGKKSFLVFKQNKYITIPTENIAFFYVKHETPIIVCFDQQEYVVNSSLERVQNLLTDKQFFRLNRQYLINFDAVKEVEHYIARKLLVRLVVTVSDKIIVSKEKASSFLQWLENR